MGCAVRYILCSAAGLVLAIVCYCQNLPVNMNGRDMKLDQYEFLCAKCMEMKLLVASGESVERSSAAQLISEFLSLNKEIKSMSESMTEAQKIRFERINIWFSTGRKPVALDDVLSLERMDNAEVLVSEKLVPDDDSCTVIGGRNPVEMKINKSHISTSIILTCSMPLSYGLRICITPNRWGGYVSGNSNLVFKDGEYICGSDGKLDNGMSFWGSGNHKLSIFAAYAGVIYGPLDWLCIYMGAGYGKRYLLWQDVDGKWAAVKDKIYKGVAAEAGLIFSWKRLSVSLGVSTIKFKSAQAEVGLGVNF